MPCGCGYCLQRIKNARTRLEYAIQEGGTLYVVEDARRMLAELEQKDQAWKEQAWKEQITWMEWSKAKTEEQ